MAKKKPSGLGSGLDTLFLDNSVESQNTVTTIRIADIEARAEQPRKSFESEALAQLADSIKIHGILQPILVRASGSGYYQIVAGERRFRAAKMAGLSEVPVLITEADDETTAQMALIENVQRENLNPLEEAMAYKELSENYGLTQEKLSEKIGKSRSAIANMMRLLDLPEEVLAMLRDSKLSAGHARALLGLNDEADVIFLARKIESDGLSVRAVENAVKKLNSKDEDEEKINIKGAELVDYVKALEEKSMSELGRRVKIKANGKDKHVKIYFEDNADLDELLKKIIGKSIEV
ncbi:MAG: ParB/RepB/Spo0J family partition protein [Clostridia bacterium]|nr:ParB/RepB/Spo0J family partition protein [Clostridia bacterium]